jgi:hypothetical protein
MTDTVLKDEGMRILANQLGLVEAERFIVLIRREPFDYTKWRQGLFSDVPLDTFLQNAQKHRDNLQ